MTRLLASAAFTVVVLAFSPVAVAEPFTFTRIADRNTPAPDGTGNFYGFGRPSIDGTNVAFIGAYSGVSTLGIYLSSNGVLSRIVDGNTPVPGGTANFQTYGGEVSLSGTNVAFGSVHVGPLSGSIQGIYARIDGTLQVVANGSTPYPGGGVFEGFDALPVSISGHDVAFVGIGSDNRYGVDVYSGGTVNLIADTTTGIPNGTGDFSFQSFQVSLSQGRVAMRGGQYIDNPPNDPFVRMGIYSDIGGQLSAIADPTTPMPGTSGNFESVGGPVIDGNRIAFNGYGQERKGIFLWDSGVVTNVVDTTTLIPGGTGTFANFGDVALDGGNVAFIGTDPNGHFGNGQEGIYVRFNGTLMKVIDLTDTLDGRPIEFFGFGREGLSGNRLAISVRFSDDNTDGVYVATLIPEPSTGLLSALGLLFVAAYSWQRKRRGPDGN